MVTSHTTEQTDISSEKLAERQIEYDKLKIERIKAWGSVFSIPMSFLIATLTIVYGIWSHDARSRVDFEMKAAEIVIMSSSSPSEAANKAIALKKLFPNRLPPNFAEAFAELVFDEKGSER